MRAKEFVIKFGNILLRIVGSMAILLFLLSLTDLPYEAYHWLGTSNSNLKKKPNTIVLLGGSGMPSPDGFIRCYYAAEAAAKFPLAPIIIALPFNENDSNAQQKMMAHELLIRGIDTARILYESLGFNTHSQAENIAAMHGPSKAHKTLVLITSPEHMYRSVKVFEKAGYLSVGGVPTFEKPIDKEKIKDKLKTKDKRVKSLDLRYNIWSYLHYELLVCKEFFAISYYKLKGWI